MKNCIKCNNYKDLGGFPKDSRTAHGYRNVCRQCVSARFFKWKQTSSFKEYQKEHYKKQDKDKLRVKSQQSYQKNKAKITKTYRERRKTDVNFKISQYLRNRVNAIIHFEYKAGSAIRDLGCSVQELKAHLEASFQSGMSWENYGKWHIDHIFPLSKADLSDRQQFLKVCHYSNLQPLWAADNIRKSNKLD